MKTKCVLMGLVLGCVVIGSPVWSQIVYNVNWEETFDNNSFDLPTWEIVEYPDWPGTPTLLVTIEDGPADNDYLQMHETLGVNSGGSAFGLGMADPNDIFTDVRLGATVNINGDASWGHHLLGARARAYPATDLNPSANPGHVADAYVLHIDYEEGPANLVLELEKVIAAQNNMRGGYEVYAVIPGLEHDRSYYAQIDVIGSDPVYITCALFEEKGGDLIVRLPTLVDTNAQDEWEDDAGLPYPQMLVYPALTQGSSGVSGINENEEPIPGYKVSFDDVSSKHDGGPAAVGLSPADGAAEVAWDATLEWVEPSFATGRTLWFGTPGSLQPYSPAGTSYDLPTLQAGQTYEWRVDVNGSSETVTGYTYSFTTEDCIVIDDFESYPLDSSLKLVWDPNAGGAGNIYVETGNVYQGSRAMRLDYNNDSAPFYKEVTRKFDTPQDWLSNNIVALTLAFRGDDNNAQQPLYVRIEDNNGTSHEAAHDKNFAVQTEVYRQGDIELGEFTTNGVDLSQVKKLTFGVGNKTSSPGQGGTNRIYIDFIRLYQPRCLNPDNLDLRGDVNGDCKINLYDLAIMANGWLNDGMAVTP